MLLLYYYIQSSCITWSLTRVLDKSEVPLACDKRCSNVNLYEMKEEKSCDCQILGNHRGNTLDTLTYASD